jgi:hypothetical protein
LVLPMGSRTKPVRLYDEDAERTRLAAAVEGRTSQDVVHDALNAYFTQHREQISAAMSAATQMVLHGDTNPLRDVLMRGAHERAENAVRQLEELR